MDTIKLEILNNLGDTEHHLSNGDVAHYNINGDMLYYYDGKYKTIETVVYADVGVPHRYQIVIYGQTFVYSFNDVPPFQLDEMFDMLKQKFVRQIQHTGIKYSYDSYGGYGNQPIVADWDMSNIDCYGRLTNHIDVNEWDFRNVPSMLDDSYGLDYGY